jgi:hypothetical protein
MLGFSPAVGLFALVFSSLLRFDPPMLSPDGRPKPPQPGYTLEELTAGREWVPAARAFQSDGTLDHRVFREEHADTLHWMLKDQIAEKRASPGIYLIPQGNCSTNLEVSHDRFGGGSTLDELIRDSMGIYSGRIVSEEPGFFNGLPVLLVKLKIESSISLAAPAYRGEFLDVFYPHTHFALHGYKICGINNDDGIAPKVGDKALVFASYPFPDQGTPALMPAPEQIAIQSASGRLAIPRALRLDRRLYAVESLAEMETALRHILSAAGEANQ